MTVNCWVSFFNVVLWSVNTALRVPSESVLFLCTVHISYVPSGKCSLSVHNTHFWYPTMWRFFKYSTFSFISNRFYVLCFLLGDSPASEGFMLFALLSCDFTVVRTVPVPVETCNRSSFPYEFDRYEILGSHLSQKAIWHIQLKALTEFEVSQRRSSNVAHIRASSQLHHLCFAEPSLVKWHHF
jgi:hypothetical protein